MDDPVTEIEIPNVPLDIKGSPLQQALQGRGGSILNAGFLPQGGDGARHVPPGCSVELRHQ